MGCCGSWLCRLSRRRRRCGARTSQPAEHRAHWWYSRWYDASCCLPVSLRRPGGVPVPLEARPSFGLRPGPGHSRSNRPLRLVTIQIRHGARDVPRVPGAKGWTSPQAACSEEARKSRGVTTRSEKALQRRDPARPVPRCGAARPPACTRGGPGPLAAGRPAPAELPVSAVWLRLPTDAAAAVAPQPTRRHNR